MARSSQCAGPHTTGGTARRELGEDIYVR
jgi:hypothetical protein